MFRSTTKLTITQFQGNFLAVVSYINYTEMNAIHIDRLEYADSSKLNVVERQESSGYNPKYLFWTLINQSRSKYQTLWIKVWE